VPTLSPDQHFWIARLFLLALSSAIGLTKRNKPPTRTAPLSSGPTVSRSAHVPCRTCSRRWDRRAVSWFLLRCRVVFEYSSQKTLLSDDAA